ncbi:MAG: hypothetical protein KIT02_16435 [Devosia sp.]|uniref:histidine kinase dimerization/phospho-acceptor domain-containing protein n=1 Tax=Devosia sp. TaxID=1871048 RepID=UPI0024C5D7E9|nr:histidine kinase dimerization/phospho-acceptor domain-containing protein [Devosia sp.]UYN99472.1 MAG: hypothetical protein KIT02_16435 [Devosia sp.]
MNELWSTLPNAPRVLQHADDARPAWLWSQDGQRLIWQNDAAGLFMAKNKKHGLKLAPPAIPIKGQVARIIRLGSSGRSSLARIQFLAGEKPVSATCATTPLKWSGDEPVLLIVGVDAIGEDILLVARQARTDGPEDTEPAVHSAAVDTTPTATETFEGAAEPVSHAADADDSYQRELESWQAPDAEQAYETAAEPAPFIADAEATDTAESWQDALSDDQPGTGEPAEPEQAELPSDSTDGAQDDGGADTEAGRLSALFDRLAADDALFTPLSAEDDPLDPADATPAVDNPSAPDDDVGYQTADQGLEPWVSGETPDAVSGAAPEADDAEAPATLYKIIGRGFTPTARDEAPADEVADAGVHMPEPPETEPAAGLVDGGTGRLEAEQPDSEAVERVSRYNFDELSRILTDRVGDRSPPPAVTAPAPASTPQGTGALINLGGETLVLNRLPLGILVFRDQQILFANRSITEMIGYDSADALRQAGLAAVFPVVGPEGQEAGPVNHLVQRDGTLIPVTARLQSVSWQGRPALLLSASATEVRTGHEDAVRAFAGSFAEICGDGFIETSRSGMVSAANAEASTLLAAGRPLVGRTLISLVGEDDGVALRAFLERPARFAESERPVLTLRAGDGRSDILLFALGQAGILSGYFGFVRRRQSALAQIATGGDVDPALLARIGRGIRRPLSSILGFAEVIGTTSLASPDQDKLKGYSDDIARAGQDISALVGELEEYARLREGRYLAQRARLDLSGLLESCVIRIRAQANAARVIVRNAISETLPRVTADEASLTQAVLNLLASAIDQTPEGSSVIISAQRLDDGAIAIHVRDSSAHAVDMGERFVVFRDGVDTKGKVLAPVRSSVGLALTRSLLAVNTVSLSVDPAGAEGLLFSLRIPADLVDATPPSPRE